MIQYAAGFRQNLVAVRAELCRDEYGALPKLIQTFGHGHSVDRAAAVALLLTLHEKPPASLPENLRQDIHRLTQPASLNHLLWDSLPNNYRDGLLPVLDAAHSAHAENDHVVRDRLLACWQMGLRKLSEEKLMAGYVEAACAQQRYRNDTSFLSALRPHILCTIFKEKATNAVADTPASPAPTRSNTATTLFPWPEML